MIKIADMRKIKSSLKDPECFYYPNNEEFDKTEIRKCVFEDTKKRLRMRKYKTSVNIPQVISDDDCNDENLQKTVEKFDFGDTPEGQWFPSENRTVEADPIVSIVDKDCIEVTKALARIYSEDEVAMLNMANSEQPGGHYLIGQIAQEESIFFRTNIYKFLDPECNSGSPDAKHEHYPLPKIGGLYVPRVLSIRKGENAKYRLCKAAHINVICVSGLDMRNAGVYFPERHGIVIKNKIRTIFRIAIEKKQTVLVLGALGCGAFENDPIVVANFFKEVLEETKGFFKAVVFSIISSNPSKYIHAYALFKYNCLFNAFHASYSHLL